jgi:cytochrome c oxidase subunit 2
MHNGIPLFPPEASNFAPRVDALFFFLVAVTGFFTLLIFALIVTFIIRFRRRRPDERPEKTHSHMALELAWSVIPLGIAMVIFVWGAVLFYQSRTPPPNAETVAVIAKQWMWKIQHQDGHREINELHIPVGLPIVLEMTSQDVIHDFSVPAFRLKQDVVPGAYTHEWFIPTQIGQYHLFCDQYCGTGHALMTGTIYVMSKEDYQQWLGGAPAELTPRAAGEKLFTNYGCIACHSTRAPSLAGVFGSQVAVTIDGSPAVVRADEAYIRESILDPGAKIVKGYPNIMPSFRGQLSEEQIMDLMAYIKSLSGAAEVPNYSGPSGSTTQPEQTPPPMGDVPSFPNRVNP